MSNKDDKRSSVAVITLSNRRAGMSELGVGARQTLSNHPGGGGGYLSTCTESDFSKKNSEKIDPRIQELMEIGLGKKWLNIAEAIGYDHFMAMWRILDSDEFEEPGVSTERIRVWVPAFKRYLKYQRNRYILFRAEQSDSKPEEIRRDIREQLGESLSSAHIKRIMSRETIKE